MAFDLREIRFSRRFIVAYNLMLVAGRVKTGANVARSTRVTRCIYTDAAQIHAYLVNNVLGVTRTVIQRTAAATGYTSFSRQ